jgi:hypothetical protein
MGNGAWISFFLKYQFSFAGDANRPSYRVFFIQPEFGCLLGKGWAVSSSPEMQYNCKTDRWFIPLPISVSKSWKHVSLSAEYKRGIVTDFPVFQDEAAVAIRYSF